MTKMSNDYFFEKISDLNLKEVLRFLSTNPLENTNLIADCIQLRNYCQNEIYNLKGEIRGICSLFISGDFFRLSFRVNDKEFLERFLNNIKIRFPTFRGSVNALITEPQINQLKKIVDITYIEPKHQLILGEILFKKEIGVVPERLSIDDLVALRRFYQLTNVITWSPDELTRGPYYGIKENHKGLVSVAGVHYVTPIISEIGNIATHPDFCTKGYSSACILSVINEIKQKSKIILIHLSSKHSVMVSLFKEIGFIESPSNPFFFIKFQFQD